MQTGSNHGQDSIVAIVDQAGVPYDGKPTRQNSYGFVRFIHHATDRSLNLGFQEREGRFVADFVFKRKVPNEGEAKLDAFLRLFGGEVGRRETPFARLKPRFDEEAWLIDVIRAYWAMGRPMPRL